MKKPLDYILLYVKGLSMGAVDIIPGISGGSIAFMTGIYNDLIRSLRSIDRDAWQLLVKGQFRALWDKINGSFLLTILLALLTSVIVLAEGMAYLLRYHPIPLWSFYFGTILLAAPLSLRKITKWTVGTIIFFFAGIVIMYLLTRLNPLTLPGSKWTFVLAGAIGIGGLLLPGVSGGFLLVLLGKYQAMVHAITRLNVPVLVLFLAGCVLGLLGFTRILTWVLDNYYNTTVALFAGFMLGSLNKVWPWREPVEYVTYGSGEQVPIVEKSILPWDYVTQTGKDPHVFQAILFMAIGVFVVVLTERITARLKTKI